MTSPLRNRADISSARRIVVKIGSSSLTGAGGRLDVARVTELAALLARHRNAGQEVVLVSSGAIAAGIAPLGLPARPHDLATAQATASVGQGLLIARYTAAFAGHGRQVGQVLLTAEDLIRRQHYRNAQRALQRLLALGVVPVVNENDTVATGELRFGDNDRLAALVAHLVRADLLVLLTDVDGLYDGPPSRPGAALVPEVADVSRLTGVEVTARGSTLGTGGMVTKLESAAIATNAGVPVVLTSADNAEPALAGADVGTWFAATGQRKSTRRLWLAHAAHTNGRLVLDDGAVTAITHGKRSLLAAGITGVEGDFEAGDAVQLARTDGVVMAHGLSAYAAGEVAAIRGRTSSQLREQGADTREVVHRDDLVIVHRY